MQTRSNKLYFSLRIFNLTLSSIIFALFGTACAASGPVISNIAPDVGAGVSVGTTITNNGAIFIIDGGTLKGGNLFESFSNFDLAAGDTAAWTISTGNAANVSNVISRVTGGSPSQIYGTIDSTALPNAAFYFINPAGIVFGQGSKLNVPGATHFSTASQLVFSDSAAFSARTPLGSTLTMAPPAAFGFLGGEGDISITNAGPNFGNGNSSLSFSAANVSITNSIFQAGQLDLIAVGNQQTMLPTTNPLSVSGFSGNLAIDGSNITTIPTTATTGAINLGGGDVSITDDASVQTLASNTASGGNIAVVAQGIEVDGFSNVTTVTRTDKSAGDLMVNATSMLINGVGTNVSAGNTSVGSGTNGAGNAGQVTLTIGGTLALQDGGGIGSDTDSSGNANGISIQAQDLIIRNNSIIQSDTFGSGNAGLISINAGTALIDGGAAQAASIQSSSGYDGVGTGNAGQVNLIVQGRLTIQNGGYVASIANDPIGAAGDVSVSAGSLLIDGGSASGTGFTAIASDTNGAGNAGKVSLNIPGPLVVQDGGLIASRTYSSGNAGSIAIKAQSLAVLNGASINSSTQGSGDAGIITVNANSASIDGGVTQSASIESISYGGGPGSGEAGKAGQVSLDVEGNLAILNGGYISSASKNTTSAAGDVSVMAGSLLIDGGVANLYTTAISSDTSGSGNAGQVNLTVGGDLTVQRGGSIQTQTSSSGNGGDVSVYTASLVVQDNGAIESGTFGSGNAGVITVNAGKVLVDGGTAQSAYIASSSGQKGVGTGNAGKVSLNVLGNLTIQNGGYISSVANGAIGAAGDVSVIAGSLLIDGGSAGSSGFTAVASDTGGAGNGGRISVNVAGPLIVQDGGAISSQTYSGGNAGSISIKTQSLAVLNYASIRTSTYGSGDAGSVTVASSGPITLSGGSSVTSSANVDPGGSPGNVTLSASALTIKSGALVVTSLANSNKAGDILINAPVLLIDGANSQVSSVNNGSEGGAAGYEIINAEKISLSNGGVITTNAATGPAGNITLNFPNVGMLFLEGKTAPGEITTSSGSNTGGRISIADPYAIVLNGGRIEALGPAYQAYVTITANEFVKSTDRSNELAVQGQLVLDSQVQDVSKGTDELKVNFADAFGVLIGHCATTRGSGQVSALTIGPTRGPYQPISTAAGCCPDRCSRRQESRLGHPSE